MKVDYGSVDPSLRASSGRLKFTVRHDKFNKKSFSRCVKVDYEAAKPNASDLVVPDDLLTMVRPLPNGAVYFSWPRGYGGEL